MTCGPVVVLLDYGGLCQKILVLPDSRAAKIPGDKCLRTTGIAWLLDGVPSTKVQPFPTKVQADLGITSLRLLQQLATPFWRSIPKSRTQRCLAISSLLPPPEVRVIYPDSRPRCRNGSASAGFSHLMLGTGRRADARRRDSLRSRRLSPACALGGIDPNPVPLLDPSRHKPGGRMTCYE